MSKRVQVKADIQNLGALARAAEKIGGKLNYNQKEVTLWYTTERCDHAITFPNSKLGVGVKANEQGTYDLVYDDMAPRTIGNEASTLLAYYTIEAGKDAALACGYVNLQTYEQNDNLILEIET